MKKPTIKTVQVKESPAGTLNGLDFLKALAITAITGGLSVLYTGLAGGSVDWKTVGIATATAGVGYLIKNLSTSSVKEV